MKEKRILIFLLLFVSIFVLPFILSACGGDNKCEHSEPNADGKCDKCGEVIGEPDVPDNPGNHGGDTPTVNEGEFPLIMDGKVAFSVLVNANLSTDVKKEISNFIDELNDEFFDGGVERVSDRADEEKTYEIIFGSVTSRGENFKTDEHYLGYEGYSVKIVGTKIFVLGGSDRGYRQAIKHLEDNVFKFDELDADVDTLVVTDEDMKEEIQSNYDTKSITVAGNDLRTYVIAIPADNNSLEKSISAAVNDILYKNTGIWLETVSVDELTDGQKAVYIETVKNKGDRTTAEGFHAYVDTGENLRVECEFPDKFFYAASSFFRSDVAATKKKNVEFNTGTVKKINVRDIYYSEFGAVGNGIVDDFNAIKACHDYANSHGHTVNADGDKTYLIGEGRGSQSIIIRTDTYWHGATFIFDDSDKTPSDPEWNSYRFIIDSEHSILKYSGANLPVTSIGTDATNVGFAPGYRAMVIFYNEDPNAKLYFRYGTLADAGDTLHELVITDADGNIDPSTPLQWDFTSVTKIEVVNLEDDPITVSGADGDAQALVETMYFQSLGEVYNGYTTGDFRINRSNVVFKNIYHKVTGESSSSGGASYAGFTSTEYSDNVTFENFTLYRYDLSAYNTNYRSYEIRCGLSNNVTWRNCDMSNFFDVDGSVRSNGMMGTNYTKNMYFDNVAFNTFDAHRGSYNVTIENSQLVYCSIIGSGKLTIRNTTFYCTRLAGITHAIWLREDYGSHYNGDIEIDGVTLKYSDYGGKAPELSLISAVWHGEHYFGYTTQLGINITINNVKTEKINYGVTDGERWEDHVGYNVDDLYLFPKTLCSYTDINIATSPTLMNGLSPNLNPYQPPKTITITNCEGIKWVLPETPQFESTVITVDGVKHN